MTKGDDGSSSNEGKSGRKEDRNIIIRERKSEHKNKVCWYQMNWLVKGCARVGLTLCIRLYLMRTRASQLAQWMRQWSAGT